MYNFKFYSMMEKEIDISKNIYDEYSELEKFFDIKYLSVFKGKQEIFKCRIRIMNFDIEENIEDFLEKIKDENIKNDLILIDNNYDRLKKYNLKYQKLAIIKTEKFITEQNCIKQYIITNIISLISIYFNVEVETILISKDDKFYMQDVKTDVIIKK